jgi:hypothetical protein
MLNRPASLKIPLYTVLLAFALWWFTFGLGWGVFWYKIAFSALLLAVIAVRTGDVDISGFHVTGRDVVYGLISAAGLYVIFWLGKTASTAVFGFAEQGIDDIYGLGHGTSMWFITLLLFFVTGPCEEVYWRGYLQKRFCERLGPWGGYLAATACYALVHVWSMNFMLTAAAGVAGAYWGLMYLKLGRLEPVIVSHAVWSTVVFTFAPIP